MEEAFFCSALRWDVTTEQGYLVYTEQIHSSWAQEARQGLRASPPQLGAITAPGADASGPREPHRVQGIRNPAEFSGSTQFVYDFKVKVEKA